MESGKRKAPAQRWFAATALMKCIHVGKARKRHLWERTTFLLRAADSIEAEEKAEGLAREQEVEYEAVGGSIVRWTFQELADVWEILDEDIKDGTEVKWEFFERVDATECLENVGMESGAAVHRAR